MNTTFLYALGRYRTRILSWGIGLALLAVMMVVMFGDMMGDAQQEALAAMMEIYPEDMLAFFGDMADFSTPSGFLSIEFFSFMPLILGIFAVGAGSGMLLADEEKGVLDLLMSYPQSRFAIFFCRLAAFIVATVLILLLSWAGFALGLANTPLEGISVNDFFAPMLSLFTQLMFFGMLALALSLILPSHRAASGITALFLVASYFIDSLSNINDKLEPIAEYMPMHYYQGGNALEDGLNSQWVLVLLGISVVLALIAWVRFSRRDIRVAGEGGWSLSKLSLRRQKTQV